MCVCYVGYIVLYLFRCKLQATVDALEDDITKGEIPSSFRHTLLLDVSRACLDAAADDATPRLDSSTADCEPAAKRLKLDSGRLSLADRLCVSSTVREVMEGGAAGARFWRLMRREQRSHLELLLKVRRA